MGFSVSPTKTRSEEVGTTVPAGLPATNDHPLSARDQASTESLIKAIRDTKLTVRAGMEHVPNLRAEASRVAGQFDILIDAADSAGQGLKQRAHDFFHESTAEQLHGTLKNRFRQWMPSEAAVMFPDFNRMRMGTLAGRAKRRLGNWRWTGLNGNPLRDEAALADRARHLKRQAQIAMEIGKKRLRKKRLSSVESQLDALLILAKNGVAVGGIFKISYAIATGLFRP